MNTHNSKMPLKLRSILILSFMLVLLLVIDFPVADTPNMFLVKNAEAIVGAPATPGSVAGTRRRTRRRVTAATAAPVAPAAAVTSVAVGTRVYAKPAGCATVHTPRGVTYYQCGGVYYRPYFEGNSVVYVVENP